MEKLVGSTLETLARGEIDAVSAEKEITTHFQGGGSAADVYNAFATLLWHVVSERRKDSDLRKWHGLMLDVAFRARKANHPDVSERIKALTDVLRVSIAMSDRPSVPEVLRRAHVPALLSALGSAKDGRMSRGELQATVGLQSANLSRLLTLLTLSGLADREQVGKEAFFVLTEVGRRHIETKPNAGGKDISTSRGDLETLQELIQRVAAASRSADKRLVNPGVTWCVAPILTAKTDQPHPYLAELKRVYPPPEYNIPMGMQIWAPNVGSDPVRGKHRVTG